jgi:hypothetical protein
MDTMIAQMSGIEPTNILSYGIFFLTYLILILAHAISGFKLNMISLVISFASFYLAGIVIHTIPIGGVLFALLGFFYLWFFLKRMAGL